MVEEGISEKRLTTKIRSTESPREVFEVYGAYGSDFNEIHTAACFYQLAKLRRWLTPQEAKSKEFWDLVYILDFQTTRMVPYSLANTAWSVTQLKRYLGEHASKLMTSISEQAVVTMSQFRPQELSMLAWSCAKLNIADINLLRAIAGRVVQQIEGMSTQQLSNVAWAFARLGIKDTDLMSAIAGKAVSIVDTLTGQNAANVARAFAILGIKNDALMDAIGKRALAIMDKLNNEELGNLAWSFWRLDVRSPTLLTGVCDAVTKRSARGGASLTMEWTAVIPAVVSIGSVDSAMLAACAGSLLRPGVLRKANDYSVAALMRSAQLDGWETRSPNLFRALAREVEARHIKQAALESELLKEPGKWLTRFR